MVYFISKVVGIRCKTATMEFIPRIGEKITLDLLYSYGKGQWIVSDIKHEIIESQCKETGKINIKQNVYIYLDLA